MCVARPWKKAATLRMALEPTSGKAGSAMLSVQCDRGFGVDDVSATSDFRAFNAVV